MIQGIGDMLQTLTMFLPPWALGIVVAVVGVAVVPSWLSSMRIKQIKGRTRRMVRAEDQARIDLADEIMGLAAGKAFRLEAVVKESMKYGLVDLRDRAMAALAGAGADPEVVRQLQEEIKPAPKGDTHPVEAAVAIERLIDEGMLDAAAERLDRALERFPGDPDLEALIEALAAAEEPLRS